MITLEIFKNFRNKLGNLLTTCYFVPNKSLKIIFSRYVHIWLTAIYIVILCA